ncbi:MAG: hypothetical protein V1905_01910 [bacterium]
MRITYTGNGKFCWEDSAAMMLSNIGESLSPAYLEAISGCGLSAFFDQRTSWLYFSFALPNEELTHNLNKLGYDIKEVFIPKTGRLPLKELILDLKTSPAVIGPLNMGLLKYNPNHKFLEGRDHFILAYSCNEKGIFIHDPAGFPCVFMTYNDFGRCWESENVDYGNKHYHYWTNPERVKKPTAKEIYNQTMEDYRNIYKNCDKKTLANSWITGSDAITKEAERFEKNEFNDAEVEFLTYSSFVFATRCALDIAYFLQPYNKYLAQIKYKEADALGMCQVYATKKSWKALAGELRKISDLEQSFKSQLLQK